MCLLFKVQSLVERSWLVITGAYERHKASMKERQTTIHDLVPSSVKFGTSKMRLIRNLKAR